MAASSNAQASLKEKPTCPHCHRNDHVSSFARLAFPDPDDPNLRDIARNVLGHDVDPDDDRLRNSLRYLHRLDDVLRRPDDPLLLDHAAFGDLISRHSRDVFMDVMSRPADDFYVIQGGSTYFRSPPDLVDRRDRARRDDNGDARIGYIGGQTGFCFFKIVNNETVYVCAQKH